MPSDMWRIAPVLILSAIPFGNYVIFSLAFLKPKLLLCSHFWSIQQRLEFSTQDLAERLKYNKPVFHALQARLSYVPKEICKGDGKESWHNSGLEYILHPMTDDVLVCKEKGQLLQMHCFRKTMFRINKLKYRTFILLEMDKAIIREGGVDILNLDTPRHACHIRGLNGSHLTNNDMRE